jgi:uncharacterized protein YbjT (DUF2867 family)
MTGKILVTGATGNVGSEVVKKLIGKASFRVAANAVERAQRILGGELEYVHFDFLQPATFGPAFAGIEKMFLVRPPALANVKRDIAPALAAAQRAGVKQIIFLSLQGVERNPIVPHHTIEKLIVDAGFIYTFLRASFFMQNLSSTHADEIRDRNIIALPVGAAKTSFIDVRDIAAVAVAALTEVGHEHQAYTLTGREAVDYYQVSAEMSAVLGRPIHYTNPSLLGFVRQQLAAGRRLGMTLVMAALYTITRLGNAQEVTTDVWKVLGREPIPFHRFVSDYHACWEPVATQAC